MLKKILVIKKPALSILIFFLVICFQNPGDARDINLDKIYIKSSSKYYDKLIRKKIGLYETVNSCFVDRDVIFSDWVNGKEVVYIKEIKDLNIVYIYNRINHQTVEIARFNGTVTTAAMSTNGKYLFFKSLKIKKRTPVSKTVFLNIKTGKIKKYFSAYPFLDFSLTPDGNSILIHKKSGVIEFFPESKKKKLIVSKRKYNDILKSDALTIPYFSPNRKKVFIVHGRAGNYRSKIIAGRRSFKKNGITSASEIFWIDNNSIIYRKGYMGNYSVYIYNLKKNREKRLCSGSLNTNIKYSSIPRIASYLKNQIINIYYIKKNKKINCSIEGEDVGFSPDGNRFVSLLYKKLFITNINILKKKYIETKNASKDILKIYQSLLKDKKVWVNSYTKNYLIKKVAVYKEIVY